MPTYLSHGERYMQPDRHDELTEGVPAAPSGQGKREAGRFVAGPDGSAVQAGAVGGSRRKGRTHLSHALEAPTLTPVSQRRARVLRRALTGEIASTVGAGHCGIAASLFVKFAAQKTAAAEEAFQAGDYETHRKLSESARMDVLYAREHAAKEAVARRDATPNDPHEAYRRAGEVTDVQPV
jgi:hypothetical protein